MEEVKNKLAGFSPRTSISVCSDQWEHEIRHNHLLTLIHYQKLEQVHYAVDHISQLLLEPTSSHFVEQVGYNPTRVLQCQELEGYDRL